MWVREKKNTSTWEIPSSVSKFFWLDEKYSKFMQAKKSRIHQFAQVPPNPMRQLSCLQKLTKFSEKNSFGPRFLVLKEAIYSHMI